MTLFPRRVVVPLPPIAVVAGAMDAATAASGAVTAAPAGPPNLLVNPSFELPISPDVSVPVGGWDMYQNDPNNPGAARPAIFARTAAWSTDGTESLELQGALTAPPPLFVQPNFSIQPICPSTWVAEGAAVPNGWWPVVGGRRYRWQIDAFGVENANYVSDPGGAWIGIDFWNPALTSDTRSEYSVAVASVEPHILDGVAVLGLVCEIVAPPDAIYAIPLIGLFGVRSLPTVHLYVDNAFWGDVTDWVAGPPSTPVILADIGRPDAPNLEGLCQVISPDGTGLTPVVLVSGYENFGVFFQAAFNPAGSKIAVVQTNGASASAVRQLFVVDRNGSNAREITDLPAGFLANLANLETLTWSGDGSKLAMAYNDVAGNQAGICVINADNTGSVLIPLGPAGDGTMNATIWSQLRWSPDSTKFAYETYDGIASGMSYCNADGTGITVIPPPVGNVSPIDWIDNTHLLVWVSGTDPQTFQKVALDGTATIIYSLPGGTIAGALTIALSQDATQIAYADAGANIFVLPADGSSAPVLVPGGAGENFLDWGAAV